MLTARARAKNGRWIRPGRFCHVGSNEWGPDDKISAPNRTTPELVLEAVGLVKQGKAATLGKLYARDIPFF